MRPARPPAHAKRALAVYEDAKQRTSGELRAEATPQSVLRLAVLMEDRADDEARRALRDHPPARPIACKSGCSWCCSVRVEVSAPEALRIGEYLRTLPAADQERIRERLREAVEGTRGLDQVEHAALRRPCALLGKRRECTVHPVRPLACRAWNSSDESVCRRLFETGPGQDTTPVHEASRDVVTGVAMGLVAGLRDVELDYHLLELSLAVLIALERPAAGERWLRRLPVFARARHPSTDAALDAYFAEGPATLR